MLDCRKLCVVAVAIALQAGLVAGRSVAAQQAAALTVRSAQVGIGGRAKAGCFAPIWLDVAAGPNGVRGTLQVAAPDGDNVPVVYADSAAGELVLAPNQSATLLRYLKIGPVAAPITVQLRDGTQVIWSQELTGLPPRLAATQEVVVGIGPDMELSKIAASLRRPAGQAVTAVQAPSAAALPDRWWGYEGVDAVVLPTRDNSLLAAISPAQRDALVEWVRLGGRLIFSVGSRGETILAGNGSWAALAPGTLDEVSPLREREGLEAFSGAQLPWEDEAFQRDRPLVTRLRNIDGAAVVDEVVGGAGRPLVIRSAYGLGEVVFVAVDLDHPSLAGWSGRVRLLANLLATTHARAEDDESETRRSVGYLGYDDLVGQLRAALDQFAGVTLVNFTTVSVLTVAYLLLIGPGDYLLLARLNLPRHLTWFTFSLIAALFGGSAWYLGREAHGDQVRINQVEVVDIDAVQGAVRGTVWAHLFSPATAHFDVTATIDAERVNARRASGLLTWQGVPGDSLGGLGSRQSAIVAADPYRVQNIGPAPSLAAVPVQTASSKSLSVRWWGEATIAQPSTLSRNQYGILDGELVNPLPCELADCLVAHEDRLYRLGTLGPGDRVRMGELRAVHLEARLTERTVVRDKDVSTRWEQDSTDIPRIIRIMMFHEAARGRSYTGLSHRYQSYVDLSGHLRLNRAVLVGRAPQPLVTLVNGGRPLAAHADQSAQTWCRIVLKVSPYQPPASQP
jgi:hypothetical protein